MKAIIMAGGKGTRLKPLTCSYPKPMVPIVNQPVMAYTIDLLKNYGITEIGVTLAYMPTAISDYFGKGEKWGVELKYYIEESPLGTGGSVRNAAEFMDETLLVVSGDALTDLNLEKALEFHRKKQAKVTLVLRQEEFPTEYGVVIINEGGAVTRFLEKPSWGEVFSNTINTGIYIIEPEVLLPYEKGQVFDFSKDLFPKLLDQKIPMYGYVMDSYWCDIGNLSAYQETHFDVLDQKVHLPALQEKIEQRIWIGEGTVIGKDVVLEPPLFIGENCIIEDGVKIIGPSVVGEGSVIGQHSVIKRSILWKQVHLGRSVNLRGAVVCNQAELKQGVKVLENSVIGERTILESQVLVKPEVKIWPQKRIEENTVVNQNLIWGTRASKILFGFRHIEGEMNTELTPEFASKIGAAFASSLSDHASILISSENSPAAKLIQYALLAGIASTGVHAIKMTEALLPMARFGVKFCQAQGGIHVRTSRMSPQTVLLEFINEQGGNISRNQEREIENLFGREDFKRCNGEKMKQWTDVGSIQEPFFRAGMKDIQNLKKLKESDLTIWVASASPHGADCLGAYLTQMGVRVHTFYSALNQNSTSKEQQLTRLAEILVQEPNTIGVWISDCGEELTLIDEQGRILTPEQYKFLTAQLLLTSKSISRLVLPYAASRKMEELAKSFHIDIFRAKSSMASFMEEMLRENKPDAYFTPQFNLWFNGIWAIGILLNSLIEQEKTLKELVDTLPVFYLVKKEIPCEWKDKGRVMREMILDQASENESMLEGIKIDDEKGWAVILPDAAKPFVNIVAEGVSQEYAEELSSFYLEKIKEVLGRH